MFSACHTQWRRTVAAGPSGAVVTFDGLDYPGVATVIRAHGHRGVKAAAVFNSVQIMEEAALEVLNKS
ncbi:hypothetical protein MoryE10_09320 [Methylogaea oryzae]|uniref:Uncharacterized protein n=1 Tax=Methylogaea oryzae TaxID=1295382 RepID=A0A8D4VMK5_9GAMM|nr:hypothetical protein MoryE10_09320 [Methylogaea oryzae]